MWYLDHQELGNINQISLDFCFIVGELPPPCNLTSYRFETNGVIFKLVVCSLLQHCFTDLILCDRIFLLGRIFLKVINTMLPKVILEIKFISIVINLNFDSHRASWKSFMVCFKIDSVRFDIFFKEPQNNRAKALFGIVAIKVPDCPNRKIFF